MDHWSILLAYSAYPVILAALAPRIRFYLHKEFRDGEIRLYLHKEFRAAEIGFSLHKEFFPKRYFLRVCMSSFGGCVCEM